MQIFDHLQLFFYSDHRLRYTMLFQPMFLLIQYVERFLKVFCIHGSFHNPQLNNLTAPPYTCLRRLTYPHPQAWTKFGRFGCFGRFRAFSGEASCDRLQDQGIPEVIMWELPETRVSSLAGNFRNGTAVFPAVFFRRFPPFSANAHAFPDKSATWRQTGGLSESFARLIVERAVFEHWDAGPVPPDDGTVAHWVPGRAQPTP